MIENRTDFKHHIIHFKFYLFWKGGGEECRSRQGISTVI